MKQSWRRLSARSLYRSQELTKERRTLLHMRRPNMKTSGRFISATDKGIKPGLRVSEIALVLVRFDEIANSTVNANHRIM